MRVVVIGGGPAGLYFSLLFKKVRPEARIQVLERNGPSDTFGWGVVFSDETLGGFQEADPESYEEIARSFAYWDSIETHVNGHCVRSTGHGFCGLARKRLLNILQARCEALGVEIEYHREVESLDEFAGVDLILAADGVNSFIRQRYAEHFRPSLDWRKCRFSWLGTTLPLKSFTFHFKENEHGLWQVHAYPFEDKLSTWIVETHGDTLQRAGLEDASEEEIVAYCSELFAEELKGHPLLINRSVWRRFPTVRCERWHHENIVLVGDAAHTAHFSIGSGTKLAMEDAISLVDAFVEKPQSDVPTVLAHYQASREVDGLKLQKAAQTSLEWFENSRRYLGQDPLSFTFNLMTRSKRITYQNLAERDPALVARVTETFQRSCDAPLDSEGNPPPPVFTPFSLRELRLPNRMVVSPMCQYSCADGLVGDWHLVHLGSRAVGGAGLIITEMTNVAPEGRITKGCAGMYRPEHVDAWARITRFVHENSSSAIGVQLAHAGRKGSVLHPWDGADTPLSEGGWTTLGPSALAFDEGWPAPKEMDAEDRERVIAEFVRATEMSEAAGFDLIELHMAHGYLLSSYLSPLSNQRDDEYGGSLEGRMRFPMEVFRAVRETWPEKRPLVVRISATDWLDDGFTPEESVELALRLKDAGCDAIDVSTAGNSPLSRPVYGRMYQVPFAEKIRYEAKLPVMAVGAIQGADHANTILAAGRADLTCLARPHLADPYLSFHAAQELGFPDQAWPGQYWPARYGPGQSGGAKAPSA